MSRRRECLECLALDFFGDAFNSLTAVISITVPWRAKLCNMDYLLSISLSPQGAAAPYHSTDPEQADLFQIEHPKRKAGFFWFGPIRFVSSFTANLPNSSSCLPGNLPSLKLANSFFVSQGARLLAIEKKNDPDRDGLGGKMHILMQKTIAKCELAGGLNGLIFQCGH